VYYVINGSGEASVGAETVPIAKGDAVPLQLNDAHSFRNTGNEDLELMILGIAAQKGVLDVQEMDVNAPARGRGAKKKLADCELGDDGLRSGLGITD
jgi:uncharacterized cupin superfamily protein